MLPALLVVYLVHLVNVIGEPSIVPRCSDAHNTSMTFSAVDRYNGRYILELCTKKSNSKKLWQVEISYYSDRKPCNASLVKKNIKSGAIHSKNNESISYEHNCTENQTVCLSAQFDLIFSACYLIKSQFKDSDDDKLSLEQNAFFNITNSLTKASIAQNVPYLDPAYYTDNTNISLTWHTGIPLSEYTVKLCPQIEGNMLEHQCEYISNCTAVEQTSLQCVLNPPLGCYYLFLTHHAPWGAVGPFSSQQVVYGNFCRNSTEESLAPVSGSDGVWRHWVWVAVGGCALLAAAVAGGARLWTASDDTRRRLDVLKSWLLLRNEQSAVGVGRSACRHVLLLYAAECTAARRAVAALTAAVRHVVEGEVLDIFSPEVTAQYAGAPHEWMRSQLQRRDVAVLLLQTPALRARCSPHADSTLVAPLLGRGAAPLVPSFGDQLLQFALRVIAENIHARDDYNKIYIATMGALPTEVLPGVVSYRRYELPAGAAVLLRDLAPPRAAPPPRTLLLALTDAVNEFVQYATEHSNYLEEHLAMDRSHVLC